MRKTILCLAIVIMLVLTGCSEDIGDITGAPEKYMHHDLKVKGTITFVIDVPLRKQDFFKMNDGTGEIWIYTEKGAPPSDKDATVKGQLIRTKEVPLIGTILNFVRLDFGYCIKLKKIDF